MLKNLLNSFKVLTLVAVSMVSGGALHAQDEEPEVTLDVEIVGDGSADIMWYDYSAGGMKTEALETKVYEFSSAALGGSDFVISNVQGELEAVEINGSVDETALSTLNGGAAYSFVPVAQGSLKLVFIGGEEPEEPEEPVEDYDMAINVTVEGGEAEVGYWYWKADPLDEKQEGVLEAGMNYLNNMWNSSVNHYHIYLSVTPADGYVIKEVYVDEQLSAYDYSSILIQSEERGKVANVRVVCEEGIPEGYHTITLKSTGVEGLTYYINVPNEDLTQVTTHFSDDEDVVVPIHDGGYFTWNYSAPLDYTVRGLLVDGKPLEEVSEDGQTYVVTSDVVLSLDYLPTDYCEFSCVEPEGGNIIIEYQEYDINIYDYVWLPLEEGMPVVTGTEYRATFETDEDYALTAVYVDGEKVFEADAADEEYEYTYEGVAWASVELKMETVALASVGELSSEPVKMDVYSIDGVLVRSCVAETVDEAVSGLAQGLYIINGQKVVVR